MSISFKALWAAYPTGDQQELFQQLGGGWPQLVGDPAYTNTCALRMTVALQSCGYTVSEPLAAADGNLQDGRGRKLVARVATMNSWLDAVLGKSSWGMTKSVGADIESQLPSRSGILLYRVPNALDASGHVDLWNGAGCRIDCHSQFARAATDVQLWFIA